MAQVVPVNDCEGDVLGFALNRAQCIERGVLPFRKAMIFNDAQILFQKQGTNVRAIVTSPEWYGPGYRGASAVAAFGDTAESTKFRYAEPTGTPDNVVEASSLYSRAYVTFVDNTATQSLKFFADGKLIHEDILEPVHLLTDLEFIEDNPLGTIPADAQSEIVQTYAVIPAESFSPYPAVLLATTVSNAAVVQLPPSTRSMNGDVVLTTTSIDGGPVKTISGYAEERLESTFYDPAGRGMAWIGSIIPWKLVDGGDYGTASAVLAHMEGDLNEEFGTTPAGETRAGVVMTAYELRYIIVDDDKKHSVVSHALKIGKATSRIVDDAVQYQWKNAPTGVDPAVVTCPNGDVYAAYVCLTGTATSSTPTGLATVLRLAGATKAGVFDIETTIVGTTQQNDITQLTLVPALVDGASLFIFYTMRAGSVKTDYIATVKLDGVTPKITVRRKMEQKLLAGASLAVGSKVLTVAGSKAQLLTLSDLSVQDITLPDGALTFKRSKDTAYIVGRNSTMRLEISAKDAVNVGVGVQNTDSYILGKGMSLSKYRAPAAGEAVDEDGYKFLLEPLKYTKEDAPETAYGFTTYQWEFATYTTYSIADHENWVSVGLGDVYSDFPTRVDTSHAFHFGAMSMPSYTVTSVPVFGLGLFNIVSAQPPPAVIQASPSVVGASLPNSLDLDLVRGPLHGGFTDYAKTYSFDLINQFTTVYPGITTHNWTPHLDADELIAWMQV